MSVDHERNTVAVTRRIEAPAATIFDLLCDPPNHAAIDGSGMLRSTSAERVSKVGDTFVVQMWNEEMGEYEMTNLIVEFEPGRVIRWQPTMTNASRRQDREDIGNSAMQRWGFELTPVGNDVTEVTETFDCIDSPEWLRNAVKGGERWVEAMTETLEKLAARIEAA